MDLSEISYNTFHQDQIEIVFKTSSNISGQPTVRTSLDPAYIEITFNDVEFDEKYALTTVDHAGVTRY